MGKADQESTGRDAGEEGADAADAAPGSAKGVDRRGLLLGGAGVLAGLGVAAYAARDELSHWWWRLPGQEKPRKEGEVDFRGAQWVPASPANYRRADRPADYTIDRVVIHVVQGGYRSALKVFQDPAHGAAAHYVLHKDGRVTQLVRELDVAYHSGNRAWNERSIGIEHEGFVDRPESFTPAMYAASARLTAAICRRYGFPADRNHIVGHIEVPGTDHTDPGPHWNWNHYLHLVQAIPPEPSPSPSSGR
ncbi:N-acetylmuramoyl-L-alanine amidase [Streptomyces sp. MST-110588]|uniref:N-acetylmuramoyl-L-alanine amidase n=1 Tax=Streptomyces sp. MST-110588 TaxID=2833628 RepID=UPI001F5E00A1|nr:N-acetylmuramoyl-L-alanine amidase [Streptomyces sp. MST-110588]UNO39801.1 N-acetylmuramoyl-L-alanine amidase [Streptomyces sp. MST-110588]